ncbi:class I SAM-dependent methyltransferase [Rhizobium leguminosarum]|uniref:class I SAM-dependent methyltransferase n=1 Tax=Rhizobium leguminosarum TaxID=384 RepID=UPI001FED82FF|nr:methyltransferase domain-containing protein [Rhizobium leguminosarum]
MSTNTELMDMYEDYYADGAVAEKRAIAARQSLGHILKVAPGRTYDKVIDIGAGEGAVLSELSASGIATSLAAVEISKSGIDAIRARKLPSLSAVDQFDGYKIPHSDKAFDLALAIHVLEQSSMSGCFCTKPSG